MNIHWKELVTNLLINLFIELTVFYLISRLVFEKDEIYYTFVIMIGFWILQVTVWTKNFLVSEVYYQLRGKRHLVSEFANLLSRHRMPIYPESGVDNGISYLQRVILDHDSSKEQLILASATSGTIDWLRHEKPIVSRRIRASLSSAVSQYLGSAQFHYGGAQTIDSLPYNNGIDAISILPELSAEEEKIQVSLLNGIKMKCQLAAHFARLSLNANSNEKDLTVEWQRYIVLKSEISSALTDITDEFYRCAALHLVIDMHLAAKEASDADALLEQITIDFIREQAQAAILESKS